MEKQMGYCVKCKAKRTMKNGKKKTMSNGRHYMSGQCEKCGTNMSAII